MKRVPTVPNKQEMKHAIAVAHYVATSRALKAARLAVDDLADFAKVRDLIAKADLAMECLSLPWSDGAPLAGCPVCDRVPS